MNILSRIRDIRPRVKYMMSRIRDNRPMSVKVLQYVYEARLDPQKKQLVTNEAVGRLRRHA